MLKIRRPLGRLIFNMGIAIPGKTVFLIETAPCIRDWLQRIYVLTYVCLIDKRWFIILTRHANESAYTFLSYVISERTLVNTYDEIVLSRAWCPKRLDHKEMEGNCSCLPAHFFNICQQVRVGEDIIRVFNSIWHIVKEHKNENMGSLICRICLFVTLNSLDFQNTRASKTSKTEPSQNESTTNKIIVIHHNTRRCDL